MSEFKVNPTIVISAKHKILSVRIPLLMAIALLGSICTMTVCISMVSPEYSKTVFWLVTVAAPLFTCVLSAMPGNFSLLGLTPLCVSLLGAFINREKVVIGAKLLYNTFYSVAHHTDVLYFEMDFEGDEKLAVTWFMCCASAVISCLIARSLLPKASFIFFFVFTFLPVELGLYEGLEMNLTAMSGLIILWFTVLAIRMAAHNSNKLSGNSVRSGNIANCGLAAIALTTAAVLSATAICNHYNLTTDEKIREKRAELRETIENFSFKDFMESIADIGISLGIIEDPDSRDLGDKSKMEYKQKDEIKLTLSELPDDGFYLKNFTASVYKDNTWETTPEEIWDDNDDLLTLFTKFECAPQILPFLSNQAIDRYTDSCTIEIEHLKRSKIGLLPYGAYSDEKYLSDTGWGGKTSKPYTFLMSTNQDYRAIAKMPLTNFYLPASGFNFDDSTTFSFFSHLGVGWNEDTFIVSGIQAPYLEDTEFSTQSLQASLTESYLYRSFVYDNYTYGVSSDELNEVYLDLPYDVVNIGNSGNEFETMNAIRQYMASKCEYSLAPGLTPSSRDFVNYFLLENNKGYCSHFATAGTVIARAFGIPTRYCEGYVVSMDDLNNASENSDGSFTLVLQDSSSHAWCEFYVDGYGWVPFEFTPGYYDEQLPQNTPLTETTTTKPPETETITETETTTTETVTTTQPYTQEEEVITSLSDFENEGKDSVQNKNSGMSKSLKFILCFLAFAVTVFILIALAVMLRNFAINRRMRLFRDSDTKKGIVYIYAYLLKLLKFMKLTPENLQTLDFAKRTEEFLTSEGYDASEAGNIIRLALAADMGGKAPEKENIRISIKYVNDLAAEFKDNTNPVKRIFLMYALHLF